MSADNGYIIRKNSDGNFVLQMYFASDDELPPIDAENVDLFDTLGAAIANVNEVEKLYPSEYGLTITLGEVGPESAVVTYTAEASSDFFIDKREPNHEANEVTKKIERMVGYVPIGTLDLMNILAHPDVIGLTRKFLDACEGNNISELTPEKIITEAVNNDYGYPLFSESIGRSVVLALKDQGYTITSAEESLNNG